MSTLPPLRAPTVPHLPRAERRLPFLPTSPGPIVAAALLTALLMGILLARDLPFGVGLLIALAYAPLVLMNLPLGLVLWAVLVFIEDLSFTSVAPNAAGLMIIAAWIGERRSRAEPALALAPQHRGAIAAFAVLVAWLTVSVVWARDPGAVLADVWLWYVAAAVFVVVSTTMTTARYLRWTALAFVAGATLSVAIGFLNGLDSSLSALDTATQTEGRLQGGGGDPNYLAAQLVPAIVLAGGLALGSRSALLRAGLLLSTVLMGAGLAATQSRGGLIAAVATMFAALVFFKGWRGRVLLVLLAATAAAGLWFHYTPDAWDRVTSFDGGGNGRSDLWRVAGRMVVDRPVIGVGLDNFQAHAADYVNDPGNLEFVELIAEKPHVVHNAYLQILAEAGLIGLAAFLLVALMCVRAASHAARRFDELGEGSLAAFARAVLVASLGMLAASCFLSNGPDKRLWLLLALGPAALAAALRSPGASSAALNGRPPVAYAAALSRGSRSSSASTSSATLSQLERSSTRRRPSAP